MKTTMKLVKCFLVTLAITAFTASCQKDNLEDAVIPQTAQGEQGTSGTSGQNGAQGIQGEKGPKGDQGEMGVAGPEGPAGQDGEAIGVPGPKGNTGAAGASGPAGSAGEAGPAGPKGDTGDTGPAGANGTDGTNGAEGEDGNANVIASDWFGPDRQTFVVNGYTRYAEFNRKITNLDSEIYENGTLLVYAKFSNFVPQVWPENHSAPLPLTISGGTTEHIYTYYFSPTNLKIRYRQEGPADTWSISPGSEFRYIAIPSNISAKSTIDFSKMSYEDVMDYFELHY